MKETKGFITDDGSFFDNREEALLHEAESRLRGVIAHTFQGLDVDMFLTVALQLKTELGEYLHAYNTATASKFDPAEVEDREAADDRREAEGSANLGHVSSTEEDLAALLKLPARGPSNVPDVGSGPRTEEVQDRREKHGPRVRGANASSVRSRKDMAAKQNPKA